MVGNFNFFINESAEIDDLYHFNNSTTLIRWKIIEDYFLDLKENCSEFNAKLSIYVKLPDNNEEHILREVCVFNNLGYFGNCGDNKSDSELVNRSTLNPIQKPVYNINFRLEKSTKYKEIYMMHQVMHFSNPDQMNTFNEVESLQSINGKLNKINHELLYNYSKNIIIIQNLDN